MDESRCPVTAALRRSASTSSTVSRAETFHSFSTAPTNLESDRERLWNDTNKMASRRTDSGFESVGRNRTPGDGHDEKNMKACKHGSRRARKTERTKPLLERSHTTGEVSRPSTSCQATSNTTYRRHTHESRPSQSKHNSRHSSRRSSFAHSQTNARPHTLSRPSTHTTDPYTAHQRAMSIFSTMGSSTSLAQQQQQHDYPAAPPIPYHARNSLSATALPINAPCNYPPLPLSHHSSFHHSHRPETEAEPKISMHHRPTVIDWTDPSTRRRAYERHDAKRRGIEGLWRRVKAWLPGKSKGSLEFWDGENDKSDACSVRRYRLDLDQEAWQEKDDVEASRLGARKPSVNWKGAVCF